MAANPQIFAEVLVDIAAKSLGDKLFTYAVPDYMEKEVLVGSQVLVPFGNQQMVAAYVVNLKDKKGFASVAKEIVAVLDQDPLYDQNYVEFLFWVADYYCTNIASVLKAAVPADFNIRLKKMVELACANGQSGGNGNLFPGDQLSFLPDKASIIISLLKEGKGKPVALKTLKQKSALSTGEFYKSLSLLRSKGLVNMRSEMPKMQAPKLVNTVVWTGVQASTPTQEKIIATLNRHNGQMNLAELVDSAGTTYATIKKLTNQGVLALAQEEELRDPLKNMLAENAAAGNKPLPELTDKQAQILNVLLSEFDQTIAANGQASANNGTSESEIKPWLIHGVTGSGKTEIYLRLISHALASSKTALLLVPEISLTPQLAERLISRFGDTVAVWHSQLSAGERYDTWRRLRAGAVKVLLGARSAIFANMPNLGVIILDEEHDGSYKQSSPNPRYHAKTLALKKASLANALVVFGSATPDVATYEQAKIDERILELPERIFKQEMPHVELVDMREEFAIGHHSIFSRSLLNHIAAALENSQQVILLINRRGYASYLFCKACGHVVKCRNCSVSLTFHQQASKKTNGKNSAYLACHHCGFQSQAKATCPDCQGPFLRPQGLGTQKVEQDIQEYFPSAKVVRLDSDITAHKGAYESILKEFTQGKADILIGTQMVAKGLDIHNVTVVGVLSADSAFNLPDYRSIERGFQLLTQVSGRAGRGLLKGQVVLQTYNPDLPALALAKNHDYQTFVQEELASRRELNYPPYSQIIRLVITGEDAMAVEKLAYQLAERLGNFLESEASVESVQVLGPAPCLIERLKEKYRWQLIIKNMAGAKEQGLITSFLRERQLAQADSSLRLSIDVDAYDFI